MCGWHECGRNIMNYNLNDVVQQKIVYDIVLKGVNHILQQNEKSQNAEGCLYRSDSGLKCAVGALISDEFYSPALEFMPCCNSSVWNSLANSNPEIYNLDSEHQQYLETCLLNLQEIHDNKNIEDWPKLTAQLMYEIDHNNIPF